MNTEKISSAKTFFYGITLVLFSVSVIIMVYAQFKLPAYANEGSKDTLYSVYSAVKIGMTVDEVRSVVKRLSPQDVGKIPESLEPSGDSTSGTFDVQIAHNTKGDPEVSYTRLSLLFASEGYGSSLVLVSARWEKNMRNGSSLEYSKKKGR